jgi:hypothetical protein
MEKRVMLFTAILTECTFAAPDFFPLEKGNAWNFLFFSTSSAVIPNPPVTHDTGTISWEVLASTLAGGKNEYPIREVRNLVRRYQTGIQNYDSVFSPPRVTIDTLVLTAAPLANDLSFKDATCACMVHDPVVPLPSGLTIKDTTVQYNQGTVNAVKTIPANCSCSQSLLWTFCAAQTTGPVEIYLTRCNIVGTSFHETRKLISRDFPTGIRAATVGALPPETIVTSGASRDIVCRFSNPFSGKTDAVLCDAQGRVMQRQSFRNLGAPAHEIRLRFSSAHPGVMILFVQSSGVAAGVKLIRMP